MSNLLQVKLVYWGPAEAGKTTSLSVVQGALGGFLCDEPLAVQTTAGRTLWSEYSAFEFFVPDGRGGTARVVAHVSSLAGQERFLGTREFAGANADGVVFVADCRPGAAAATRHSFEELAAFVPPGVPAVVQANFQDVPGAMAPGELARLLAGAVPERPVPRVVPTVAVDGSLVVKAFTMLLAAVLCGGHLATA